jgi:RHS repeat-associated protein
MREASGIAAGLVDLPAGGGGIAPMGDRFQPDLVRGSGGYRVPIACPKGPNELAPQLALSYSTGSGNGPFGLGWRLDVPRVARRTDRGVPHYTDADTFVFGEHDVLVPIGDGRYRPRVDRSGWRVQREPQHWRIDTGDGWSLFLGRTDECRELRGGATFAWLLEELRDPAGNPIHFRYVHDGGRLYLAAVRYSIFELRLEYEPRPDTLRDGRAGFERVTAWRARTIQLCCDRLGPAPMRTYALGYAEAANGASLLSRIVLSAGDGPERAQFPEQRFEYSRLDLSSWRVHELEAEIPPPGLDDATAQLVDLTGDGLPDVLQTAGSRAFVWHNRGDCRFAGPMRLRDLPSPLQLAGGRTAFADLDGDGRVELFRTDRALAVAFEADGRDGFRARPHAFAVTPSPRLDEPNTRLMDVDGDGVTDLLATERDHFLLYRHAPGRGWQEPLAVRRVRNEKRFPDIALGNRGVALADMTGDGFQDFVSVESGRVRYWPYRGNGVWGDVVELADPPRFPPHYRENDVLVVDIDGDGCADIVHFDRDSTRIWLNRCGNGFAPPVELPVRPIARDAGIRPADLFGDGRPGFVWTGATAQAGRTRQRFLRFDAGRLPYLLTAIDNGMGGRTEIEYSSSTELRTADRAMGWEWRGELPFAVPVVRAVRERDHVSGWANTSRLHYRDGIYDGPDRHFRGFEHVSMELEGDASQPAVRYEYAFFQGDPRAADPLERERQRALAGSLLSRRTLEVDAQSAVALEETTYTHVARLELETGAGRVFVPLTTASETRELPVGNDPARVERVGYFDHDRFGNPGRRVQENFAEGTPEAQWLGTEERYHWAVNEDAWLVRLQTRKEVRGRDGIPFVVQLFAYDGPAFEGLPEGSVERGLLTRTRELRLLEARVPQGYLDGRDITAVGYQLAGEADTRGYYVERFAVERDSRGNIMRQRDALGHVSRIGFDADGVFPLSAHDALGRETTFAFDPRAGEAARVDLPDGRTLRFEYDALGRPTARYQLDDAGSEQLVQCWNVDTHSSPTSVLTVTPNGPGRMRSEFADDGDMESLAGASVERLFFTGFGDEFARVATAPGSSPDRSETRFVDHGRRRRNPRGRICEESAPRFTASLVPLAQDAAAATVRVRYDALGRMIETAGPGPVHTRGQRDTFSVRQFEGEGAGGFGVPQPPGPAVRVERFDALGRLRRIEEARGDGTTIATTYELGSDGRIAAIGVADGAADEVEVARFVYAGADGPIEVRQRDVGTRTHYRDALGRVVERVAPDGSRLFFSFDALGRTTRIEHAPAGSALRDVVRETFYDADPERPSDGRFLTGRAALVREPEYEIRSSYNRAGQPLLEEIRIAGETLVTGRTFDLQGRQTAIVQPDGRRVEYLLDDSGTLQEIPGVLGEVRYEADGGVAAHRFANGALVQVERDVESRRLVSIAASLGGAALRRIEYAHDTVGNIVALRDEGADPGEARSFGYDGLHRLTSFDIRDTATGQLARAGTYAYDALGNLQRMEEQRALGFTYADPLRPGRLTSVSDGAQVRAVEYDECGRFRAFGDWAAIVHDPLDRLTAVTRTDGTEVRFVHDAQGRRLLKEVTTAAGVRRVVYAGAQYEQHEDRSVSHVHLGNTLVASFDLPRGAPPSASSANYYVSDHHGTIVLAMDAAAGSMRHQRHSPFGLADETSGPPDRYIGRERDPETGLVHLGSRYYAPELGRFIAPDWFVLEDATRSMGIPQGHNPYSYALNNPLSFTDPSGKFFTIGSLIGFVAGFSYAIAEGERWDAVFGRAYETSFTTGVGAAMGGHSVLGPIGAVNGAMNGLMSGVHQIYSWDDITGWLAFTADSSLGIVGTTSGNQVHFLNIFKSSDYRKDLSKRQNRHVYAHGVRIKEGFFFAQGNVVSNASGNVGLDPNTADGRLRLRKLDQHETLHIWQNRIAGPIFTSSYVGWLIVGSVTALNTWFADTEDDLGKRIHSMAYRSNPWEVWAFGNVDEHEETDETP